MSAKMWVLGLALLLLSGQAQAEIFGFKINGIEGLNGVDLDDRFGTGAADTEHLVNYLDCLAYLDLEEGQSSAESSESANAEVVEAADEIETTETFITEVAEITEVYEVADVTTDDAAGTEAETGDVESDGGSGGGGGDEELVRKLRIDWSVNDTLIGKWWYSIRVGSCTESAEVDAEETDSCTYLRQKTELVAYSTDEVDVLMSDLLGTECAKGSTGEARIFFTIQSDLDFNNRSTETVVIELDYDPPAAITALEVSAGEENLSASWDDENNTETVSYKVYWSSATFDENDLDGDAVSSKGDLSAKSYQITGLDNGTRYYVAVATTDDFDNESELSEAVDGTPVVVTDGFEFYKEAGGADEGGCFIATATYGSVMHPYVSELREFRDQTLLPHALGAWLVASYYRHSPPLAELIRHRPWAQASSRVLLAPLVGAAWLVNRVGLGLVFSLALLLALVPLGLRLRQRASSRGEA